CSDLLRTHQHEVERPEQQHEEDQIGGSVWHCVWTSATPDRAPGRECRCARRRTAVAALLAASSHPRDGREDRSTTPVPAAPPLNRGVSPCPCVFSRCPAAPPHGDGPRAPRGKVGCPQRG